MKALSELKAEKQDRVNKLLDNCSVFFAFSNEQFNQNKTPLQEGEKYVSTGAGGYMPKSKVAQFLEGMEEINNWYKSEIKVNKAREQEILYELCNHEAFYTGDITDTLDALGSDYTHDEVMNVYRSEYKK
jgi:hypothetical protein